MSTIQALPMESPTPALRRAAPEQRRRSIAKTISWRTIGSLDTMMVSFLVYWIMRPHVASEIARSASFVGLFEVPNKLLLFYLHERIWGRIQWGLAAPEAEYQI